MELNVRDVENLNKFEENYESYKGENPLFTDNYKKDKELFLKQMKLSKELERYRWVEKIDTQKALLAGSLVGLTAFANKQFEGRELGIAATIATGVLASVAFDSMRGLKEQREKHSFSQEIKDYQSHGMIYR